MTRNEIAKLLNMMAAAYPTAKIKNPSMMLDAWELMFGEEDASVVYQAARAYMRNGKFFPTISDIVGNINRGQMLYGTITPPEAPKKLIQGEVAEDEKCRLDGCILYHDLCNGLDEKGECPFDSILDL